MLPTGALGVVRLNPPPAASRGVYRGAPLLLRAKEKPAVGGDSPLPWLKAMIDPTCTSAPAICAKREANLSKILFNFDDRLKYSADKCRGLLHIEDVDAERFP
jgi:hypothetical protein